MFITLSNTIKIAQIDGDDAVLFNGKTVYIQARGKHKKLYACIWLNGKNTPIHAIIMNCPPGMIVDHIDGDTLNNRRENLRVVTHKQNCFNSRQKSGSYKGVSYVKPRGPAQKPKWRSQITIDNRFKSLGTYQTEREAAIAYNLAAVQYFGEFAWLNQL